MYMPPLLGPIGHNPHIIGAIEGLAADFAK